MENPFKWLFIKKDVPTREIRLSPQKIPASDCISPSESNSSSSPSPGKKMKVLRFLATKIRPPLF